MQPDEFQSMVQAAGKAFSELEGRRVLLIGDYDTDGLSAVSILKQAFSRANIPHTVLIATQLDDYFLETTLQEHERDVLFFVDVGATRCKAIASLDTPAYILDHHKPESEEDFASVVHINPLLSGLSQSNAISSSGLAYFFALGMSRDNRVLAPLGILGALGDMQEQYGFSILNTVIVQHGVLQGSIETKQQLRLFGLHTRPLLKVLTYSSDLYIPGVTNNYGGAKRFLQDLNIRYIEDGTPRKYVDLTEDEQERLEEEILARKRKALTEDLYKEVYRWTSVPDFMQDLKELATMINACGRLGEYDIALDTLEGSSEAQEKLFTVLSRYKSLLHEVFHDITPAFSDESFVLFDYDALPPSMAGIVASMLARNKKYPKGVVIGFMAACGHDRTKLSLRVSRDVTSIHLADILAELFDFSTGGHANAAGAVFFSEEKETVKQTLIDRFSK